MSHFPSIFRDLDSLIYLNEMSIVYLWIKINDKVDKRWVLRFINDHYHRFAFLGVV